MGSKYVITIFDNGGEMLYGKDEEWRNYVHEDFDETFVIKGNKDYHNIDNAKWYKKTTDLITELCESTETFEDLLNYKETAKELYKDNVEWYKENYDINEEQLYKICTILDECRNIDDLETERDVARILYPDKDFIITTIRGYAQGEWNECLYDCKAVDDKTIDRLSGFYFGDVVTIRVQEFDEDVSKEDYDNETAEEEYFDYMAGSECYNMTHSKDVIKDFREYYGIADECSIEILHATGTLVQTVSYSYETIAESIQTIGKASVNKTKGAERE